MPNPNPPKRLRARPELLPPGFDKMADGRFRYRWSEAGVRETRYGWSIDECLGKRYRAPRPEPAKVDETTTLADYLRIWLAGLALRPNSIATHRGHVERFLIPLFGTEIRLAELEREEIKLRYAELRRTPGRGGQPLAPRTIALVHATLRRALFQAVEDRRIPFNPAARVNPHGTTGAGARARRVGVEIVIPTDPELRAIEARMTGDPLHALFVLSTLTGLRQSEALGLGWDDVDLDGRWVHVHRALRRTDRQLDDPKTAAGNRFVPFPKMLVAVLRAHRRDQAVAQIAAGEHWHNPDDLVFTDALGRPLVGSTITHWFGDACGRAGIRAYRWHDLRHVYASGQINAGVPIAVVSKRLGHASVVITSETYHHLLKDDALDTAEIAARVFAT